MQVGLLGQDAALEQVVWSFFGVANHVGQQPLLDDGSDEAGDVGMADEQPVAIVVVGGGVLAQGNLQQVLPQPAFDGDGGVVPVFVVGLQQQVVAGAEQGGADAEVFGQVGGVGRQVGFVAVDDAVQELA